MNPDSNEPDPIETVIELEVPPGQSPVRIDLYLTDKTANATRSKVQRAIKEGRVEIIGQIDQASQQSVTIAGRFVSAQIADVTLISPNATGRSQCRGGSSQTVHAVSSNLVFRRVRFQYDCMHEGLHRV